MTDFENLKTLLKARNVPHTVGLKTIYIGCEIGGFPRTVEEFSGDPSKVEGYHGFFTSIEFDDTGTFVKIGVWE